MAKCFRRIAVWALMLILLCVSDNALAYSGSDYTSNSSLATKLDNLINDSELTLRLQKTSTYLILLFEGGYRK